MKWAWMGCGRGRDHEPGTSILSDRQVRGREVGPFEEKGLAKGHGHTVRQTVTVVQDRRIPDSLPESTVGEAGLGGAGFVEGDHLNL